MMKELLKSKWFKSRPKPVQDKIREYPPSREYIYKPTGQKGTLYSYSESEDGSCNSCTMIFLGKDSGGRHVEDRQVFGISFKDLQPILLN